MTTPISPEVTARLARVKLLLTDVDGVLTEGGVFIGENTEFKRFSILDGLGLHLLQQSGIKVGWISNRHSKATQQRADELKVDFLSQGKGSKVKAAEEILAKTGLSFDQVCFVGDDLVDIPLLKRAGVAVTVANGMAEVKEVVHIATEHSGGHGAIREISELILKAQNKWTDLVQRYSADK